METSTILTEAEDEFVVHIAHNEGVKEEHRFIGFSRGEVEEVVLGLPRVSATKVQIIPVTYHTKVSSRDCLDESN